MRIHSLRFWKTIGISFLLAIFVFVLVIGTRRITSRSALRPKPPATRSSPSASKQTRDGARGTLARSGHANPLGTNAGSLEHHALGSTSVNERVTSVRPVSLALARAAADAFLAAEKDRIASLSPPSTDLVSYNTMEAAIGASNVVLDTDGTPLAFVHTLTPAGFVVTSANTGIQPVVAFSFVDPFPFDDTATNVLLGMLKADMRSRMKHLSAPSIRVVNAAQANFELWTGYEQQTQKR